jgi:hypothetical protein
MTGSPRMSADPLIKVRSRAMSLEHVMNFTGFNVACGAARNSNSYNRALTSWASQLGPALK